MKYKHCLVIVLGFSLFGIFILFTYFRVVEQRNVEIDEYNFTQLEKVKNIMLNTGTGSYEFRNIRDFNELFNTNIEPINKCYYLGSDNGEEPYIFGFMFESKKYKKEYGKEYYAYPKYDMKEGFNCLTGCYDYILTKFLKTIKNSCRGNVSGYIYDDTNQNGVKDIGEKGVFARVVAQSIDGGSSGQEHTDNSGYFEINDLKGSKYRIEVEERFGKEIISPEGKYYDIEFTPNDYVIENINFGFVKKKPIKREVILDIMEFNP